MKHFIGTLTLFLFCASLSAKNKKTEKLPQHQLVPFYTNAVTGITETAYNGNQESRYVLNCGLEYNVKLLKWFSIGTGLTFILHRSYSSFYSDSLTRPTAPTLNVYVKSSERTSTTSIIDLPLRILFTVVKRRNLEFQIAMGASFQTIVFQNSKGIVDYYGGPQYYNRNISFDYFADAIGIGVEMGPILKVGDKNGIMIQPEFRLNSAKIPPIAYSVGLKLGWFFNVG